MNFGSRCAVPGYTHTPPTEGIGISRGGGGQFCKTKKLKECMKLNQNFQMGRRVLGKILSVGGYGYFLEPHNIFFLLPFLAPVV